MKSIYRCTATHQGDRCQFARYHLKQDNCSDEMKNFHVGTFTVWDDKGVVQAKAVGAETRPGVRRNRRVNRVFRALTGPRMFGMQRDAVIKDLDQLVKFYGEKS